LTRTVPSYLRVVHWFLLPLVALVLIANFVLLDANAQQERGVAVEGYITGVHSPAGFDVNGTHVLTSVITGYRLRGEKKAQVDSPLRNAVQVGSYVVVEGHLDSQTKTARAETVVFRDDWDQKLAGFGVIERVIRTGPEPVFETDGYLARITVGTKTSFHGDVKTLAGVSPGMWLRYVGTRDKTGVLVAEKARFAQVKATDVTAVAGEIQFQPPKLGEEKDGHVRVGMIGELRTIPAQRDLQERVSQVGMSVVPDYQKAMATTDPFKIAFRFYAIEDRKVRSTVCSSPSGLF